MYNIEPTILDRQSEESASTQMARWDYWQARRKAGRLGGGMRQYLRGYWNAKMGIPEAYGEETRECAVYAGKLRLRNCSVCGRQILSAEEGTVCRRCEMVKMFRVVKCAKCKREVVGTRGVEAPYLCSDCR